MKKLIILIPAYNEAENIKGVVEAIPRAYPGIDATEIIVFNDGSTDGTQEIVNTLNVQALRHEKNLGLGRTFRDGLKRALELRADYLVHMDGDGQFDTKDIPRLLEPLLRNEADLVTASRFLMGQRPQHMSSLKYWGNRAMSRLVSYILGAHYHDVSCGFRALNREAMLWLNLFGNFTYTQEVFLDLGSKGLRIREVPVAVKYFPERRSRVASNLVRYAWQTLNIILRTFRDYQPLKFFGWLGIGFFVFGCLFDLWLIIFFLRTGAFTPFKIVGFTGAFFNILGLIIFFQGLMADMLLHTRLNQEQLLYWNKRRYYQGEESDKHFS